ncbi:TetR/AcrR family transcriptional regulator [Streptomyces sp. UC4497]
MGHREDLLEGAKRCLMEKGFARTTARDIVKESGTNLASIGYHYGSKDTLLAQAYVALVEGASEGWGEPHELAGAPGSLERFQSLLENVVVGLGKPDSMWHLSIELLTLGDKMPALREYLVQAQTEAGRGFIGMIMGEEPPADDPQVATLGGFLSVMFLGLVAQYTFDPETSPSAEQLTVGLRQLFELSQA